MALIKRMDVRQVLAVAAFAAAPLIASPPEMGADCFVCGHEVAGLMETGMFKRLMLMFATSAVWTESLSWATDVGLAMQNSSVIRPADASTETFSAHSPNAYNRHPIS